jgi:hypothetical protein
MPAWRFVIILALTSLLPTVPTVGLACVIFGADQSAVDRVQSSWGPAEAAMRKGSYSQALDELRSTAQYLPTIHNPNTRRCVGEGANIRITSASAGQKYLATHPGDLAGAKVAADAAWRAFPMSHNCP